MTWAFWLALLLPGYAVLRRVCPDEERAGLLGVVATAYLATFAVLSPVSIAGYWLGLPLGVLSGACVLLVAWSLVDISLTHGWRPLGRLLLGAACVELVIVGWDMWLGSRVGTIVGADALTHLTRVRFLLDSGLTNVDPFVGDGNFWPIYHTNLLHALLAACCQLTREDHFDVWFAALPMAKLLIAAGAYRLAWTVFERQWPAWLVAVFVVGARGPVTFVLYPNQLAPLWLLALAIAFTIELCRDGPSRPVALKLAAVGLVIGQIHSLYGMFAVMACMPLAAVAALLYVRSSMSRAARIVGCSALLALALPYVAVSMLTKAPMKTSAAQAAAVAPAIGADHFTQLGNGMRMLDPRGGFGGGGGFRFGWLAFGIAFGLLGSRRCSVLWLLAVFGVVAAVLYTPPLCTALLRAVKSDWIALRFEIVLFMVCPVLTVGSIALVCERWLVWWGVRPFVAIGVLLGAIVFQAQRPPYDWSRYRYVASLPAERRTGNIWQYRQLGKLLADNVPAGGRIVADEHLALRLPLVYDCFVIYPASGSIGVRDHVQRRRDLRALLAADTPASERAALLRKYDTPFLFTQVLPDWAQGHAENLGRTDHGALFRLSFDDAVGGQTRGETP